MEIPKSTVRFEQVVKECGQPQPVALWTDPKENPGFQSAMRSNRVATVIQETVGTHKDFGVVGFHRTEHASYWVFPRSLKKFEGKRIIGIKYDLLNVPKPKDPGKLGTDRPKKPVPQHDGNRFQFKNQTEKPTFEPEKAKPELHRYRVLIRCTATAEETREVEAATAKGAQQLALRMAAEEKAAFSAEQVVRRVTGVHRLSK